MVKTYCKKPVPVKALQWNGTNIEECKKFCGAWLQVDYPTVDQNIAILTIHTLEGDMTVSNGDFIIQGVEGEFYPCKGTIFKKTYIEVK